MVTNVFIQYNLTCITNNIISLFLEIVDKSSLNSLINKRKNYLRK